MNFEKPRALRLPIILRQVEVSRVARISPTLQRIWFTGPQLAAFSKDGRDLPPFRSEGPDDHVKFFFPSPADGTLILPAQRDGVLEWPRNPGPVARDYTPRGYKDGDAEVAFDFVLHGHGVATRWAATAKPGDTLHMAGPKASLILPAAPHVVLIGDQTALPAICNWLERLPHGTRVEAVIWIEDEASRIAIDTQADATITWVLDTDPEAPKVEAAVRALSAPGPDTYVWGALEASVLRRLRAYYIDDCKLERGQVDMAAYWRRGIGDDEIIAAAARLNALADLATPFALRAAVATRLPQLVAQGVNTVETLAEKAGLSAPALGQILPLLIAAGVFRRQEERIVLGVAGELIVNPYWTALFDGTSPSARLTLSATDVTHFLRTGRPAYEAAFGRDIEDDAHANATFGAALGHDLGHVIAELAGSGLAPLANALSSPFAVLGTGADAVLTALLTARRDLSGTAIIPPYALPPAREHAEENEIADRASFMSTDDPATPSDTLVIAAFGAHWTDEALADAARARQVRTLWVIGLTEKAAVDDHVVQIALGYGVRTGTPDSLARALGQSAPGEMIETETGLSLASFSL